MINRAVRLLALLALVLAPATAAGQTKPTIRFPALAALPRFAPAGEVVGRTRGRARPSLCGTRSGDGSYGWPVAPFDEAHPVRGNFGDPRTVYDGDGGRFSFHNGIDVAAPAWTPVYPVVSGVVRKSARDEIVVVADDGRTFQYWHLLSAMQLGERVRARRTVLGWITARAEHVHLAEIDGGVVRNPLAPGHLTPYRDRIPPTVRGIAFRGTGGRDPEALTGTVDVVAWADDATSLSVPAPWHGLPVAPARVSWTLLAPPGRVVSEGTAFDVTRTEPDIERYSDVYAGGTYQNAPVVDGRHPLGVPGRYLFHLLSLDTARLDPGSYVLAARAEDICGNAATLSVRIGIAPHPAPAPAPAAPAPAPPHDLRPAAWPAGRSAYTVVLASIPKVAPGASPLATARTAIAAGLPSVGVLDSSRVANLAPGFEVVFSGVYADASAASAAAFGAAARFPGAYPRLVIAPDRSSRPARQPARSRPDVVLASIPLRAGRTAAQAEAARARAAGIGHVRVLRSNRLEGFRPGYYVLVGDRASPRYPTAYTRTIIPADTSG